MPVSTIAGLPAAERLRAEGIEIGEFRSAADRAEGLTVAILNLMPKKEETEADLLRALSAQPVHVNVIWLHAETHKSRNTAASHLNRFYTTFSRLQTEGIVPHAMIVTGAPIEKLEFEDVDYWPELCGILDHLRADGTPALLLCWAAFAGLYHSFGIKKHVIRHKISGVFNHAVEMPAHPLALEMQPSFDVPHSRFTEVIRSEVEQTGEVDIIAASPESGLYLMASRADGGRETYVTGHSEYGALTLDGEYRRDMSRGLSPDIPAHYYPGDNPAESPRFTWEHHRRSLFGNWILGVEKRHRL